MLPRPTTRALQAQCEHGRPLALVAPRDDRIRGSGLDAHNILGLGVAASSDELPVHTERAEVPA